MIAQWYSALWSELSTQSPSQVCLRQVDMELLCQLWTINEQITELRKRWESNVGIGNANNGEEEEEEGDDVSACRGTPGMPAESAILEVEEMEQDGGVAVFDGQEEFRMRNGGENNQSQN